MAYNNAIPQATDVPANSQAQLLANFQAIKTLVDVNHSTFSSATEGKHKHVTSPVQAASPATLAGETALFSRTSTLTGVPELCIRKESNGAVYEMSCLANATGWTRLPSGILLKWGLGTATGDSTVTFPVAATIPVFTTVFNVQLTLFGAGAGDLDQAIRYKAATPLNFTCYGSNRTTLGAHLTAFTYLAIGI